MNEIACLSVLRVPQSGAEEISAFDSGRWELSTPPRPHLNCQNISVKMAVALLSTHAAIEVKSLNCHFELFEGTLSRMAQLFDFIEI